MLNQIHRMKKLKIILSLLISINCFGTENFSLAESYYNQGKYKLSIQEYEKIISEGKESPELYFNLGNCYFQINQYLRSKNYYLKSLYLDPKLEIAKYNIEVCNIKIKEPPKAFYMIWSDNILQSLELHYWIIISIFSLITLLILVITKLYLKKKIPGFLIILIIIINVILYSIVISKQKQKNVIFNQGKENLHKKNH